MKILTVLPALMAAGVIAGPTIAQAAILDFSTKGDFVYLDYNPPGGKMPAVKLACAKGLSRVDVAQYDVQPVDQGLTLSSGGAKAELAGKKAAGAHGDLVKTQIFASDKVMVNFRSSGQLDIAAKDLTDKIAASGPDKAALEQFFAGCQDNPP